MKDANKKSDANKLLGEQLSEYDAFISGFGLFILNFARTELVVYKLLLRYGKISEAVGRSIFSGDRANNIALFILSIIENTNVPKERAEHIKFVLQQFNTINTARNEIVHSGTLAFTTSGMLVDNAVRVKNKKSVRSFRVSSADVQAMNIDCQQIMNHLSNHFLRGRFIDPRQGGMAGVSRLTLPSSWRYKSPQPNNNQPQTHDTAHKQRVQRPSYRQK